MHTDKERISALGGPAKVADLLGYSKQGGVQRVQNWVTRGIPAKVKLDHPDLFLKDVQVNAGHGGRQPASPHNIMDTVPESAVISPTTRSTKE